MSIERNTPHPDDAGIEDLLRRVGPREEPSAGLARDVEAAVHEEWRAVVARRRARRNITWGIAASVSGAIALGIVVLLRSGAPAGSVATLARVDGRVLAGTPGGDLSARIKGTAIAQGEMLQTDEQSRVALALDHGVSVRLDHGTTVTFMAADRAVLRSGALYVDAPRLSSAVTALIIETPAGSVHHVGTQYQVRAHSNETEVSVREGRVLIENAAGTSAGGAGESIRVTLLGEVRRTAITPNDPAWDWAAQTAPRFDIDNQSLAAFLDWLARETGRHVVYSSAQAEAAARAVKLRGSIEGLNLDTSLAAVLSTTQLRRYETQPDAIGITLAGSIDPGSPQRPTN